MNHNVIATREHTYPFATGWVCVCGHKLKSKVFGIPLDREFAKHREEADAA